MIHNKQLQELKTMIHNKQLQELKTMVEGLSKEVVLLKATVSENQPVQSSTSQQQLQQETQTTSNDFAPTLGKQTQPSTTTKMMNRPMKETISSMW